jgi:hypothetical protein
MTTIDLQNLDALRLPELQALYAEVTGKSTKSPNKKFLIRNIREAMDAQATEIIEEDVAIEKMQGANEPGNEPATEQDAKPAKAKRAKRSKKAAPAVEETTTEADATKPDVEPATEQDAETIATEQDAETDAEAGPTSDENVSAGEETGETEATEATEETATDAAEDDETTEGQDGDEKPLRKLSIPELQARYREVVGRPTGSSHRRYLIWKIREAQKGRVPVGPRTRRSPGEPAPEYKILPFRMEADVVDRLDAARERMGLRSRMDLFRKAIASYLSKMGESELAAIMDSQP